MSHPTGEVSDPGDVSSSPTVAPPVPQYPQSSTDAQEAADVPERETFARKIDFLLTCMGFSIGLGNVWRFPFLAYKNGGGAFLIPYFLAILFAGIPLFLLESTLGQFMRLGPVRAWNICPLFQGIGFASTMITLINNCYYNVIMAWCFFYLFNSFQSELPWGTCNNDWNTPQCVEDFNSINMSHLENSTLKLVDPATEFWENKALQITDGITDMGGMHWQMMLCYLLAWVLVYFIIWKGIRASGKVLYVTTPVPFIVLLILLIRGVTLDGAGVGLEYFLVPDFEKLSDIDVWSEASSQVFFSYCLAYGCHTAFGSYNDFHHNSHRDVMFFAVANTMTSMLSGMAIFSTLGFMAEQQGVSVDDVAESGPGLAFIAYPKAVTEMPVPQLWSILFFIMFIGLGLNSQFLSVEGIITTIEDFFPTLRKSPRREMSIAAICAGQFLVGLPMVTQGGMYVFQLFDYYGTGRTAMLVGFLECSVIAYIYGVNRYYDNLEVMYGFRLNNIMKSCWFIFTPLFTLTFFFISTITYSELSYERTNVVYVYPTWAIVVGWSLAASSIIWVPAVAIYKSVCYWQCKKPLITLLDPKAGGPLPPEVPLMLEEAHSRSNICNNKHPVWCHGNGIRSYTRHQLPWNDSTYRVGDCFYTNESVDYHCPPEKTDGVGDAAGHEKVM